MNFTNIFDAAEKGTIEDVRYFIEQEGVNVNVRESGSCRTPLLNAVCNSNLEVIKYLISKGADVNAKNIAGATPLHCALSYEMSEEVAKCLISNGANINIRNDFGKTPKDYARKYGKEHLLPSSGGCYVATAVYGSYDAPEVLSLRRFRDEILAPSIFGRMFISLYYRFSPPIAERLKNTRHINMFVRKTLDKFVARLNKKFHNQNEEV